MINFRSFFVIMLLLGGLSACISPPRPPSSDQTLHYLPEQGAQLLHQYAPVFLVEKHHVASNRIGTVRIDSHSNISIDPDMATLYAEQRNFTTSKGNYTNLIYRVHFQEVPAGFSPFYLGAGKNVGLFVVVTLGPDKRPLLYTTVHTCGCYLAFIPTSYLPQQKYPKNWSTQRQIVLGESLPTSLTFDDTKPDNRRIHISIRPDTHRVTDAWLAVTDSVPQLTATTRIQPLADLRQIPTEGQQTTSFFEKKGARSGYVKESYKFRERLLMSWWALDWNIGQDKYLGINKDDGPVFYTSLKPWARDASDMRDFASFLDYWGWGL